MKILTTNYITCAVKACKSSSLSFPLHFQDAELVQEEVDFNAEFIINILPRIEWDALVVTAAELGFTNLPTQKPEPTEETPLDEQVLKDLHKLLLETQVTEGKLVCGNCQHVYNIHQGIANFLLPNHLV